MRKSYIQIFLVMVCIFSTYLIYEQFFKDKSFVQIESENNISNENISIGQSEEKINSDEKEKNLISNLKYKSFDAMGNEYLINSRSAISQKILVNYIFLIMSSVIFFASANNIKVLSL